VISDTLQKLDPETFKVLDTGYGNKYGGSQQR
jgi:hypothetical protein